MSESLEERLKRLEKTNWGLTIVPDAELDAFNDRLRKAKIDGLRVDWNASPRHLANRAHLIVNGPWSNVYSKVLSRCGSGFLIVLMGKRGPGKTQMATELMWQVTENLRSAKYVTAVEFFMEVKRTFRSDSKVTDDQLLDRYTKPSLLVIDEVSKRSDTEWENLILGEMIDRRYRAMKDTLLISNLAPADFSKSVGDSIVSRLTETGGFIECEWESFRK